MKLLEVVGSFELETISIENGEEFKFRLDVLEDKSKNSFLGKVYRLETYRLQPTFPQDAEGNLPNFLNDGLIYILDEMIDTQTLVGKSIIEVKNNFIEEIKIIFNLR